jgi:hypothetical protein
MLAVLGGLADVERARRSFLLSLFVFWVDATGGRMPLLLVE